MGLNDTVVRVNKTLGYSGTANTSADLVIAEQPRRRFLYVYVSGAGTALVGIGGAPGLTGLEATSTAPLLLNAAVLGTVYIRAAAGTVTYKVVEGLE